MTDGSPGTALRGMTAAAALVIIVAGLQASGDILLPIVFSVFLAVAMMPVLRGLQRLGVPSLLAILLIVLALAGMLAGLTGVVAGAVRSFTADIGQYEAPLRQLLADGLETAEWMGFPVEQSQLTRLVQPDMVMSVVGQTLGAVVTLASRLLIVLVTVTFILLEASELTSKLKVAFGSQTREMGPFTDASAKVQRYLLIKSIVSAVTGGLAAAWCAVLGLDFAVIWGVTAFLANYIPSIGSIGAAIPPVLLAIVQLGWPSALAVMLGYIAINVALGNFIEPRLMGRSLGLSPLVVFLSLILWGWVWGPVGMLFSVPMTVIAKLVLESSEETRWIAVMMGSAREAMQKQAAEASAPAVELP